MSHSTGMSLYMALIDSVSEGSIEGLSREGGKREDASCAAFHQRPGNVGYPRSCLYCACSAYQNQDVGKSYDIFITSVALGIQATLNQSALEDRAGIQRDRK